MSKVLFKKDGIDNDEEHGGIYFESDGTLGWDAYSYHISSHGYGELTKEETYELYLKMKEYFEK